MEEPKEKMSVPITVTERSPGALAQDTPLAGQFLHQKVTKQMIFFSTYISLIGLTFNFDLGQSERRKTVGATG